VGPIYGRLPRQVSECYVWDMRSYHVSDTARIAAPPHVVYELIADYRDGHPRIIPPKYFRNLVVERGGRGAGTVITFDAHFMGSKHQMRGEVTEPEPGRRLVEAYPDRGTVTTFLVEPDATGPGSVATIASEFRARPGVAGAIERWLTTRLVRTIYREELALLAQAATSAPPSVPSMSSQR
jgi:hypothetical protein